MGRYWTIALLLVVAAGLAFVTLGTSGLEEDQVVQFDFDEESVTDDRVLDQSGAQNHGELVFEGTDSVEPTVTEDDGVMRFEDGSHHVQIDLEDRPLEGDFTVVVEARNDQQEHFAGIVASDSWRVVAPYDRYGLYTTQTGIDSKEYEGDRWTQLTAVHRDGTLEFSVDGEFVGDLEEVGELSTETIYIGQRPGAYPYTGEIADVRIYDRAATPAEVNALYVDRLRVNPIVFTETFQRLAAFAVVVTGFVAARYEVVRTDE